MPKPRLPRQTKILRGTFRASENPKREIYSTVLSEVPKAPSFLNRWGKKKWKEIASQLVADKILTAVDIPALEICCDQYGIYCELRDAITHVEIPDGTRIKISIAKYLSGRNSQTALEYSSLKSAANLYKAYASEFGLTAASRNRIDLPERAPAEIDETEALLEAE